MAFTEFCCRSGGSNLNAGTRTGNSTEPGTAASLTYASGTWVSATGVFTVASGDPSADGVAVGDFASVYADGATVTTLVGRVTARTTTTITVSTTAKSGTTTDGTSNRTLKIGGAWLGPNAAVGFPLTFVTSALVNAASDTTRINLKNDQTYSISAAITVANAGPFAISGFTTTYGDTGRATFTVPVGASFSPVTFSGANLIVSQLIVNASNFTSGANHNILISGAAVLVERCVSVGGRANGFNTGISTVRLNECEAYGYAVNAYGFDMNNGGTAVRCIAHDGAASSLGGFRLGGGTVLANCISDTCPGSGFVHGLTSGCTLINCVAYNCTSHGLSVASTGLVYAENCIFVGNGAYGINNSSTTPVQARNCGFVSNTSGTTNGPADTYDTVSISSGPFTDPANGDFRLNSTSGAGAAAKAAGRGTLTQTASSYAGTVGYPDLGAAQSVASGGGAIGGGNLNGGFQ